MTDPKEWLLRYLHDPPVTIERCLSVNEINSIEDLFSSDLTDEQLKNIYGDIETPILWIWSKEDVENFVKNRLANKNNSTFILLEKADHAVKNEEEQMKITEYIIQLILSSNK